ncbi:MAG: AMP-binding protein, partial [Ekhidna sp.]
MNKFNTPLEAFQHWLEENPAYTFLRQPINRSFIEYSREEVYQQACNVAAALQAQGLKKGDHVALLSKNC